MMTLWANTDRRRNIFSSTHESDCALYALTYSCVFSVRLWSGTSEHKDSGWWECHSWSMALAGQHAPHSSRLWRDPHQWPVGAHSSPLHHNVRQTHTHSTQIIKPSWSLGFISCAYICRQSLHRFTTSKRSCIETILNQRVSKDVNLCEPDNRWIWAWIDQSPEKVYSRAPASVALSRSLLVVCNFCLVDAHMYKSL